FAVRGTAEVEVVHAGGGGANGGGRIAHVLSCQQVCPGFEVVAVWHPVAHSENACPFSARMKPGSVHPLPCAHATGEGTTAGVAGGRGHRPTSGIRGDPALVRGDGTRPDAGHRRPVW